MRCDSLPDKFIAIASTMFRVALRLPQHETCQLSCLETSPCPMRVPLEAASYSGLAAADRDSFIHV